MASLRFTVVVISLALSVSVHAWPQIPSESRFFGEEIRADSIVSDPSSRSLPVVGESISAGTLPIPSLANGDALESSTTENNDNSLPDSLQEDEKRELPEEPISPGLLTLPIVHVERPVLQKRGVEVRLDNRSDLAYYAQRKSDAISTSPSHKMGMSKPTNSVTSLHWQPCSKGPRTIRHRILRALGQPKLPRTRSRGQAIL